jgi:hypothetical protein
MTPSSSSPTISSSSSFLLQQRLGGGWEEEVVDDGGWGGSSILLLPACLAVAVDRGLEDVVLIIVAILRAFLCLGKVGWGCYVGPIAQE